MSLKKNVKTNSLSKEKEKEKTINKRNTNIEYINNTKTLMIEPKYVNHKIIKTNNNSINQSIKIKKNNLIGIGNVNFSNIIRKNISKDKKPKLNIKNISINHTKQFKLNKAITTHNSKEKNNPTSSKKSSSLNKQKNTNDNSLIHKIPRKNLSIKI